MRDHTATYTNSKKMDKIDLYDEEENRISGYDPAELLKAPGRPPKLDAIENKSATQNSSVKYLVTLGIALALIGLLIILSFSLLFGFSVMLLGAASIFAAVFTPVSQE